MIAADIPTRFVQPFAFAAGPSYIRPVPLNSQIGIDDGAASLTDGFPPDTFVPVDAGGVPPDGRDFNGILQQITAWSRWAAAGGPSTWNAAWSASAGGYPLGAYVMSATVPGVFWISTVDNNTTNPDTGGAGWSAAVQRAATAEDVQEGTSASLVVTAKALRDAGTYQPGPNGWRIEPDGHIRQWGYSPTFPRSTQGPFTINFNFGFPNAVEYFGAHVINAAQGADGDTQIQEVSISLGSALVRAQSDRNSFNDASGYRWEATGY